jgi:protein tyrosine phosphatase (PTP) superfamily phosphohydrolase (DUF442 family)
LPDASNDPSLVHETPEEVARDRKGMVRLLNPFGRLWLRAVARVLEYASDLVPTHLNLSWITGDLAVGGAPRKRDYRRLAAAGITGVIDCRAETSDDEDALRRAGIRFLRLPIKDRYAHSNEQLQSGVRWAVQQLEGDGKLLVHCQHGVGRAPLVAASILISQGLSAPEAIKTIRSRRWQSAPNDRQIEAILSFEEHWKHASAPHAAASPAPMQIAARPSDPPPSAPPTARPGPSEEPRPPASAGEAQPSFAALHARLDELQRQLNAPRE